jgi:hypothetical protein
VRTQLSRTVLVCSAALALTACGGSDGLPARLLLASEAPGSNCPTGGSRIDAGLDADGNGVLDPSAATSTQYVCNGAGGAAGAAGATGAVTTALLVETSNEAAGASCAAGGQRIRAGYDSNGNGALDPPEVASTGYVCNGATGAGVTWVHVTDSSVQATANRGYLADNTAQVTVTRGADTALATVELYVNGSLRSTDTSNEVDRSLWQGNLQIGKPATNSRYYSGELDHIRVFSRSLRPAETILLFEEGRR